MSDTTNDVSQRDTVIEMVAQIVRDHRLQPRWRSSDGPPVDDYECLCGERFFGVAEWSHHASRAVADALKESRTSSWRGGFHAGFAAGTIS